MRLCYHPEKERRKKDERNYFSGKMLSKLVIKEKTKAFQAREQNKRESRKRNAENKVNNEKISSVA